MLIVVAVPAMFAGAVWSHVKRVSVRLSGSPHGGTTFLLLGSDSRAEVSSAADRIRYGDNQTAPGNHADLILVVRISGDGHTMQMAALPRDLVVTSTAGNLTRLGPVLDQGLQAFVDTVCRNFGIGVDHVALVHFIAFTHVIDAVGGVDVTLPDTIRDRFLNVTFVAGRHHFDGRTALTYIRARHIEELRNGIWVAEPAAALDRGTRTRDVLTQLGHKLPSYSDPVALARVAWTLSKSVTVDDASGLHDLLNLKTVVSRIGSAHEVDVPVDFHPGDVPVAWLTASAKTALAHFNGGALDSRCANATVPIATRQPTANDAASATVTP